MIPKEDHRGQTATAGTEVEALHASDPLLGKEAWTWMRRCYRDAEDRPTPPARVTIELMTVKRVALYWMLNPLVRSTPVATMHFTVDDSIPKEEEATWAIILLHKNRPRGPSRMRTEHLWYSLVSATREESPDPDF